MAKLICTTFPDTATAKKVSAELVERGMAACTTLFPGCDSIYLWNGKLHDEEEVFALIKTSDDRVDEVLETLQAQHPYEVPEGLVVDVESGLENYLSWVETVTDPDRPSPTIS